MHREVEGGRLVGRGRRRHLGGQRPEAPGARRRGRTPRSPSRCARDGAARRPTAPRRARRLGARRLMSRFNRTPGNASTTSSRVTTPKPPVVGRPAAQHVLRVVAPRAHGVALDPPVRVVHVAQLGQGQVADGPVVVGRAVHRLVVADNDVTVLRRVHVELDGGGAALERPADRQEGGRRALERAALVGVGDDPAVEPARRRRRHGGRAERGSGAPCRRPAPARIPPAASARAGPRGCGS